MKLTRNIPLHDLQVGDYFKAQLSSKGRDGIMDTVIRTCELKEIHGPILRVQTSGRKSMTPIYRDQIRGLAWGNR